MRQPRITAIEVTDLGGPDSAPDDDRYAVVARVGDVSGWSGPINGLPAAIVREYLAGLALGQDATDHRDLYRRCLTALRAHDRGIGTWAIGALDCAIWDLHARLAGERLAALLTSGPTRGEVRAYASWLSLDLGQPDSADQVAALAAEKYLFTKWGLPRRRERPAGPEAAAMAATADQTARAAGAPVALDALGTWCETITAIFAGHADLDTLWWLEDPLARATPQAYRALAERCPLPLGLGERTSGPAEVLDLLAALRPAALTFDVAWSGGITPALDLLALARSAGVPVYPHGRCFLSAVQLAAAFPDVIPAVEFQTRWEPRRQALCRDRLLPIAGTVHLPDAPGIGSQPRSE